MHLLRQQHLQCGFNLRRRRAVSWVLVKFEQHVVDIINIIEHELVGIDFVNLEQFELVKHKFEFIEFIEFIKFIEQQFKQFIERR